MLLLTMPLRGVAKSRFELARFDASAPERSGRLGGISLGAPLWEAEFSLSRAATAELEDEWSSFLGRLRGQAIPFLAWDRLRIYPRAHGSGFRTMTRPDGSAFDGSATDWSQTIDANGEAQLTLTGLPAGLRLNPRDYCGFRWDAEGADAGTFERRHMVRVEVGGKADATGEITVTIEPAVPELVPEGAVAHLDRPSCVMRAKPGSIDFGISDESGDRIGGKFAALQDLRP
ncbi:hypothetical protein [Alteriqipengyuania sp.]|uniref:hypothetical protein n=1 Tax=Alteriqipengyuania sp. TaxID=2800692 RepID=UPI0035122A9E